jgi:predicted amidohydrolase YtcJ
MTRSSASGRILGAHEGVSLEEGLRLYTHDAAFAAHEEGLKGTITTGKLADLVVLGEDLTRLPADELDSAEVELVLVDGEVAFAA